MPQLEVNSEYRKDFIKAEQTFLYQLVYDPTQRKLVPLTPYPPGLDPSTYGSLKLLSYRCFTLFT